MGFPDTFKIPVSDTQAYKQFGNSVVVPVVVEIAKGVAAALRDDPSPLDHPLPIYRPKQLQLIATG